MSSIMWDSCKLPKYDLHSAVVSRTPIYRTSGSKFEELLMTKVIDKEPIAKSPAPLEWTRSMVNDLVVGSEVAEYRHSLRFVS